MKFNVTRGRGEAILDVPEEYAAELTQVPISSLMTHTRGRKTYTTPTGFLVSRAQRGRLSVTTTKILDDWDEMTEAGRILICGEGQIVTSNGQGFVARIKGA